MRASNTVSPPLYIAQIAYIHAGSYHVPIVATNAPNIQPGLHTLMRASYTVSAPLYTARIAHIHVGSYPVPIVPTNAPNIQPELHTLMRASSTVSPPLYIAPELQTYMWAPILYP